MRRRDPFAHRSRADLGSQMPYEVQLSMASGDDWFAPSFATHADSVAQTQVAPLASDPNVIGYFTDTELDWGPFLGSGPGYKMLLDELSPGFFGDVTADRVDVSFRIGHGYPRSEKSVDFLLHSPAAVYA